MGEACCPGLLLVRMLRSLFFKRRPRCCASETPYSYPAYASSEAGLALAAAVQPAPRHAARVATIGQGEVYAFRWCTR